MALISAAVLVPVIVVLLVVVNLRGDRSDEGRSDDGVADVGGSPTAGRADLPVLPVDVPPVTPEADAACPALMRSLPLELVEEPSRRVDSDSPFAYAWGDPPVVLICGVDRPAGHVVGVGTIEINGVEWFVDTSDPDTVVWTTVDRPVHVEVQVPASTDSASITALTPLISAALPYREPQPAG